MFLLLGGQDGIHLSDSSTHHGQRIHKIKSRYDGGGHAKRQEDDGQESLCRQAAMQPKQPTHRQDGEHLRREESIGQCHAQLALFHPVEIILGIVAYFICQTSIGAAALIERFDDFNAVDVLDQGAAHLIGRLDSPLVILAVASHDGHHKVEGDREHHKAQQSQPPVQHEEIQNGQHRSGNVGGHFREQMRQRGLHAVHLIYDGLLELPAGSIQHGAQRKFGQLCQQELTNRFQDVKSGFMGDGQGTVVEHRSQPVTNQRSEKPCDVCLKHLFPGQQQSDDLRCGKIRDDAAHRADYRQYNSDDELSVLVFAQLPDTPDRALFFHWKIPP